MVLAAEQRQGALAIAWEQLPAELIAEPRWVVWASPNKAPLNPSTLRPASTTDRQTWSDFAIARAVVEQRPEFGIGFVLTGHAWLVALDLDSCRDPVTGEIADWAEELMADANSYTEISPSGTGLHIIGRTSLPPHAKVVVPQPGGAHGKKQPQVEVYLRPTGGQFITLTGRTIAGYDQIRDIEPEVLQRLVDHRDSANRSGTINEPVFGTKVPEGQRHAHLVRRAAYLRSLGVSVRDILAVLKEARETECEAGTESVSDDELRGIARWTTRLESDHPDDNGRPVDLLAPFKPPLLPLAALPGVISRFARHQAYFVGVDPAGPALFALAVCAAVIPDKLSLQPKVYDEHWRECARVWVAVVAPPSGKKSPSIAAALRPLQRIEQRLWADYIKAHETWERLHETDPELKEPRLQRLILNDATSEAAGIILDSSPDGVLVVADELSGWFGALEKYTKGKGAQAERAFWLQAWNGGPFNVDRAGRRSLRIPNLSASIMGGIQPGPLQSIVTGANEDGLLQRFLYGFLRPATVGADEPDRSGALGDYERTVQRIWDYGAGLDDCPPPVRLSAAAQKIRRDFSELANRLAGAEGMEPRFAAWCGKLDGQFARLLLVYHCLSCPDPLRELVADNTAASVHRLFLEFLIPHSYALFAGNDNDGNHRRRIAGLILARGWTRVTTRNLSRHDKAMRSEPRLVPETMSALELCGWVTREDEFNPRSWIVDPQIHELFVEHAVRERAQRAENLRLLRQAIGVVDEEGD